MLQSFIKRGINEELLRENILPINGVVTCAFASECPKPWHSGSIHCVAHHREVVHAFLTQPCPEWNTKEKKFQGASITSPGYESVWNPEKYIGLVQRKAPAMFKIARSQETVVFQRHKDTSALQQLRFLHWAMKDFNILLVDVDIVVLKRPYCVLPTQCSIRSLATGDEITGGYIEHHSTLDALVDSVIGKTGAPR